jgi:hypothetical protein
MPSGTLPDLLSPLSAEQVLTRLEAAAKKGRLPGFETSRPGVNFCVDAFGAIFDYQLHAAFTNEGGATRIRFLLHRRRKIPALMAFTMAITVWPGLPMTDSMLRSWLGIYDRLPSWVTYAWYIPLTVLPLPWVWWKWQKTSLQAAEQHGLEQIAAIAALVDAPYTAPESQQVPAAS